MKLFETLLDIVFPRSGLAQHIHERSPAEISQEIPPAQPTPSPTPNVALHAARAYQHPLARELIKQLKYRGDKKALRICTHVLHDELLEILADHALFNAHTPLLLIPIPLSKNRLRERGFNQSELLAHELMRTMTPTTLTLHTDILTRVKDTPSQTRKNRKTRFKNIQGCFAIHNTQALKDSHIILLDDVITTTATMHEAARALLAAGAKKVTGIAVAH